MALEVLLMTNVADLGSEGDVVTVADGYARNYLLPKKLAAPVTEATRRRLAKIQEERDADLKAQLESARARAAQLEKASCTITVKVGEDEKMYGSVGVSDIVSAFQEQGVELDKNTMVLAKPIKELGVFDVSIQLHPDIEASVKVWVVEE